MHLHNLIIILIWTNINVNIHSLINLNINFLFKVKNSSTKTILNKLGTRLVTWLLRYICTDFMKNISNRERNLVIILQEKKKQDKKAKESGKYIFRTKVTMKGVTYYAKDYGKKAFKIPV